MKSADWMSVVHWKGISLRTGSRIAWVWNVLKGLGRHFVIIADKIIGIIECLIL